MSSCLWRRRQPASFCIFFIEIVQAVSMHYLSMLHRLDIDWKEKKWNWNCSPSEPLLPLSTSGYAAFVVHLIHQSINLWMLWECCCCCSIVHILIELLYAFSTISIETCKTKICLLNAFEFWLIFWPEIFEGEKRKNKFN